VLYYFESKAVLGYPGTRPGWHPEQVPRTRDTQECALVKKWVNVNGLTGNKALNGGKVFIIDHDEKTNTYNCLLNEDQVRAIGRDVEDPMSAVLAIKPQYILHESLMDLVGNWVVVQGLSSRPDLNHTEMFAVEWNQSKTHYNCRMPSGQMISIRPGNLRQRERQGPPPDFGVLHRPEGPCPNRTYHKRGAYFPATRHHIQL